MFSNMTPSLDDSAHLYTSAQPYVYLPGGPAGSADAPSDFFNQVQVKP